MPPKKGKGWCKWSGVSSTKPGHVTREGAPQNVQDDDLTNESVTTMAEVHTKVVEDTVEDTVDISDYNIEIYLQYISVLCTFTGKPRQGLWCSISAEEKGYQLSLDLVKVKLMKLPAGAREDLLDKFV